MYLAQLLLEMGLEPNPNRTRTLIFERTEQNYCRTTVEPSVYKFEKNPNRTEPNNDGSLIFKNFVFLFHLEYFEVFLKYNMQEWTELIWTEHLFGK